MFVSLVNSATVKRTQDVETSLAIMIIRRIREVFGAVWFEPCDFGLGHACLDSGEDVEEVLSALG